MDLLLTPAAPVAPVPPAITRSNPVAIVETTGVVPVRADTPAPTLGSLSQKAAVTRTQLGSETVGLGPDATQPVDRVLKPYGVVMLPEGPTTKDDATTTDAADTDTIPAEPKGSDAG